MDLDKYKDELNKINSSLSALESSDTTNSFLDNSTTTTKSESKFKKYINYIIIGVLTFLLLYLIKPIYILEVQKLKPESTDDQYKMVINKKRFLLIWIISTVIISLALYFYKKFKSKTT